MTTRGKPSRATKKPTPQAAKKKTKKAARPRKAAFASVVREAMAAALPGYRHLSTGGGSGPIVTFVRSGPLESDEAPGLRELVAFQKGLYGASWFRVSFFPVYVGGGCSGVLEHTLCEGATAGPDVRWSDEAAVPGLVHEACAKLEASARRVFAPFERAEPGLARLFAPLVAHYARWLKRTGASLPDAAFVDDEEGKLPAFDSFRAFLDGEGLTRDLPGDLETPLWRFWHGGRPMRERDYHRGDYYDCSICGAFVSFARARLVARQDAHLGTRHELVCKKHT